MIHDNDDLMGWAKIIIGEGMMNDETVADYGANPYMDKWFKLYTTRVDGEPVEPVHAWFWVYINGGPVRLSLRDCQALRWHRFWPTETPASGPAVGLVSFSNLSPTDATVTAG